MALTSEKQYNTFVKGFITEASPLTFPENSSLDEDNFVLERNGSRNRRLGLDFESGYNLKDTGLTEEVIASTRSSFYVWASPGGLSDLTIGVIRVYNKFWFVNLLDSSPSSAFLNLGNPIVLSTLENSDIDAAVINNSFIIVSQELEFPVVLSYDPILDVVTQDEVTIKIRDFFGLNDSLKIIERPVTLSSEHRYNLVNQGWSASIESGNGTTAYPGNAIDVTFTRQAFYPANSDIWFVSKEERSDQTQYQKYRPQNLKRTNTDNSRAPQGAIIIDAFNRGASREEEAEVTGLVLDKELGKLTTVASYGTRVFYAGISSSILEPDDFSPNYNGYIFFSQIATSKDKLGKCYQEADPTSENNSDLVDTDGGVIHIPEISRIIKLIPSKSSLLIFAENGVWELYSEGKGFTATAFALNKVSSTGVISKDSIVESNGTFLCFTKAGIYSIFGDQVSGRYQADNISLGSIQTYYNNLPDLTKKYAKAFFDEKENVVRWLYNDSEEYSESNYINKYTKELVLDISLGAFYKNSFSELPLESPYVTAYVDFPGFSKVSLDTPVYVETDLVLIDSNEQVIITESELISRGSQFGFLTFVGTEFTISKFISRSFTDWFIAGLGTGAPYESYLITGYELFGDSIRNKQTPYIFFFFERTEDGFSEVDGNLELDNPSGCTVQAQWNWANSVNSGKWGTPFTAYRFTRNYIPSGESDNFDYGYRVITTKNKVRGSGRALSLKIQSESGKDMKLLGWTVKIEATDVA